MGPYSTKDDVKLVQSIYAWQYGKDIVNPGTRMLALSAGIISLFIKRCAAQCNFYKSEVLSYIGSCICYFALLPTVQAWFCRLPGDSEAPATSWVVTKHAQCWLVGKFGCCLLGSRSTFLWTTSTNNIYGVLVLHAVWQEFPILKLALFWRHWDSWEFHSRSFKGQETEMLF